MTRSVRIAVIGSGCIALLAALTVGRSAVGTLSSKAWQLATGTSKSREAAT